MAAPLQLADDQRLALMKLRRNVGGLLREEQAGDRYLIRWLKSRRWDSTEAEKALRASLEWREKWNMDKLSEWEPPEVLTKYVTCSQCGFDKDGTVVVLVNIGNFDIYGVLHAVSSRDFMQYILQQLERYLKVGDDQEKKFGPDAAQLCVVFNLENFDVRQYMWKPALESCATLLRIYEANYPESLKNGYIINAPRVFAFIFSMIKKLLHENTISKIHVYKADPSKWRAALLKTIPEDQLPVYFGGTLADPDGNPRLITRIHQGGKVPIDLYQRQPDKSERTMDNSTTVIIRKGNKHKVNVSVTNQQTGSLLSWEFRSEAHDIRYGVVREEADGSEKVIIPLRRVPAHLTNEIGTLTCEVPATYSIVLDNSYSLLRDKKITYSVRLMSPVELPDVLSLNETSTTDS